MKHFRKLCIALLIIPLTMSCDTHDNEREEVTMTGDLDATRMVAMGNSLTAGIIDGGWTYDGLAHSYATQIARQIYGDGRVGDDPAEHQFLLGRIRDPGNPVPAQINSIEEVGKYEDGTPVIIYDFTLPETRLAFDSFRVENVDVGPNFNNLAVPGFIGLDVLQTDNAINFLGSQNPFYTIPLRDRGSQLEQALEIDPTFVILWIGNNEVLGSAMSGGTIPPYPSQDDDHFSEPGFQSVLSELLEPFENTGTRIILGTVPDVTSIPFVTEVGVEKDNGSKGFIVAPDEGNVWKDTLTFYGTTPEGEVRPVLGSEHVLLDWLLMDPYGEHPIKGSQSNPLPDKLWLTARQQAEISDATSAYNQAIEAAAGRSDNIAVADMHSFYNRIIINDGIDGYKAGLFGGLFSLDGVHPGKVGHAYIANEFIKVLNESFGAQIATLNPQDYDSQRNLSYQESKN
ncbi:MAG: SGNH/GDSL hydrolase family protein [Balneolales bacterium]